VTITVTCYSLAPSNGDHLFACGAIFWSPQYSPAREVNTFLTFVFQNLLAVRVNTWAWSVVLRGN